MQEAGRRSFLLRANWLLAALLGGVVVRPAFAQQVKLRRIGLLYLASRQSFEATGRRNALVKGMRDAGYGEGKDFAIEGRFADGKEDKLVGLATELVGLKVDVILTVGSQATHAAFQSTATLPIVTAALADPVSEGYAISLAAPGRNVTGLTSNLDVMPKQLDLLITAVPKVARLAVLRSTANFGHERFLKELQASAQTKSIQVFIVDGRPPADFEQIFRTIRQQRCDALVVFGDTFFLQQAKRLAELSLRYKLPTIYPGEQFARNGGLMSYGFDDARNFYLAASFIDKIFKGATPATLPFAQHTTYDLVINRTTAKTLGLHIPDPLLLRADKLID